MALRYIEVSLYIQELSEHIVLPAGVIAKAERNIWAQVLEVSVLGSEEGANAEPLKKVKTNKKQNLPKFVITASHMILYNLNIVGWNKNSRQPVSPQTVKADVHWRFFGDER